MQIVYYFSFTTQLYASAEVAAFGDYSGRNGYQDGCAYETVQRGWAIGELTHRMSASGVGMWSAGVLKTSHD